MGGCKRGAECKVCMWLGVGKTLFFPPDLYVGSEICRSELNCLFHPTGGKSKNILCQPNPTVTLFVCSWLGVSNITPANRRLISKRDLTNQQDLIRRMCITNCHNWEGETTCSYRSQSLSHIAPQSSIQQYLSRCSSCNGRLQYFNNQDAKVFARFKWRS